MFLAGSWMILCPQFRGPTYVCPKTQAAEKKTPLCRVAGLPDGIFLNQKSQVGYILESLRIETFGIFHAHLEYVTAIWYILRSFCNYVVHNFG
jgi:hypothetical protein